MKGGVGGRSGRGGRIQRAVGCREDWLIDCFGKTKQSRETRRDERRDERDRESWHGQPSPSLPCTSSPLLISVPLSRLSGLRMDPILFSLSALLQEPPELTLLQQAHQEQARLSLSALELDQQWLTQRKQQAVPLYIPLCTLSLQLIAIADHDCSLLSLASPTDRARLNPPTAPSLALLLHPFFLPHLHHQPAPPQLDSPSQLQVEALSCSLSLRLLAPHSQAGARAAGERRIRKESRCSKLEKDEGPV